MLLIPPFNLPLSLFHPSLRVMGWRCSSFFVIVVLLMLLGMTMPFMASCGSIVKNLPGYDGDLPFKLESGYIGVGEDEEGQLFYLFVESQGSPSIDPLLIWFLGGPGCSGLSAFFLENGPLIMDRSDTGNIPKLKLNPYSWTNMLNIIYLDVPAGTGFSYSETQDGYYSSDFLWVEHTYEFLQKWFIDHPKFLPNPFYIGGGSYSGLLVAPLIQKVYQGHVARQVPVMNFKGYIIASPAANTKLEKNMGVKFAYHKTIIPKELYESLEENCGGNYADIDPENKKCLSDYDDYFELIRYLNLEQIMEPRCVTSGVNQGIILHPVQDGYSKFLCRNYDNVLVEIWANDENVRNALHIRKGTVGDIFRCNRTLAYTSQLTNVVEYYQNLTRANIQALIYCSDLDLFIPYLAAEYWIKSFNLSINEKWHSWFVDGQVAGYTEIYTMTQDHYLTYVIVKGAGHVAQIYKPKEVYHMIDRWFSFSAI